MSRLKKSNTEKLAEKIKPRRRFVMKFTRSRTEHVPVGPEEQARLAEARERVIAELAKPDMSREALRARARRAADWEKQHGQVTVFAGVRR